MAKFTLTSAHISTLVAISAAVAAGNTFFISAADGKPLVENGYIEVNTGNADANGNVETRLTDKGREALPKTEAAPAQSSGFSFVMAQNVAPPAVKRGGGNPGPRESKYPLKDIVLGGAGFVPSEDKSAEGLKKLSKQFGSTVAQYNKDHPDTYLTTRTLEDGKAAGFVGQNADGSVNPEAFAGVPGIGIYNRPTSERPARKPKASAEGAGTEENANA